MAAPLALDLFIDPHCHMFTVADVPLFETARRALDGLHPVGRVLVPALGGLLAPSLLAGYEPFLRSFECEPGANPRRVERELDEALETAWPGRRITARHTLATPLVMDFDLNGFDRAGFSVEHKLIGQVRRLVDASRDLTRLKVLPFLGVDPRKHVREPASEGGGLRDRAGVRRSFAKLLRDFDVPGEAVRADFEELRSGQVLGIKMYPPLGFHPLPADEPERARHLDLYEAIAERSLPLTVHCQPGSFALCTQREVLAYTKPANWLPVLERFQARKRPLRLNFGHFGGDGGVSALVSEEWSGGAAPRFRRGSWTLQIAKALGQYATAYSDISAIDFRCSGAQQKRHVGSLLWLLAADHQGRLGGAFRLVDKLMWGSDYPMPLAESPSYRELLANFIRAYRELPGSTHWAPRPNALPPLDEVLRKLCCDNPRAFLFGGGGASA